MSKKIKNEENHNTSDDDSSECSSDECAHVIRNETDTDTEYEESDDDTYTSETSMFKLL